MIGRVIVLDEIAGRKAAALIVDGVLEEVLIDPADDTPLTGAIYEAWASLGYERGALGLPTSGEIAEPEWIVQNFQHGTLNFDRQTHNVVRVIDGVSLVLPPTPVDGPPTQLERFSPVR